MPVSGSTTFLYPMFRGNPASTDDAFLMLPFLFADLTSSICIGLSYSFPNGPFNQCNNGISTVGLCFIVLHSRHAATSSSTCFESGPCLNDSVIACCKYSLSIVLISESVRSICEGILIGISLSNIPNVTSPCLASGAIALC